MSSDQQFLRREANPLTWSELTPQQRDAVSKIAGLLTTALQRSQERKQRPGASIESDRRSPLAFIDGDRGMGKTSVLLSIRKLLKSKELQEGVPETVRRLHASRKKFIILETLDMEPLPSTTNLLAAILVRISSLLEYSGRSSPRLALALDENDELEKLETELHQLELDAVLAWVGTERKRSRYADPSTYGAEVLVSERAGLKLQPRLAKVLDGLARIVFADDSNGPIFLVPVDDFDLTPTRCLELLRIIRMISTPRLFFLIAGTHVLRKVFFAFRGRAN